MKSTPALVRLERKLARDRTTILDGSDVRLLNRELQKALADSFPGLPANALDLSEDLIRWRALGERCKVGRGVRGIREMSVMTGIPQFRLRAIESGHLSPGDWHTNVSCRRSPGRKRCRGEIIAELNRASGYIEWRCTICGDNGMIGGWEHTLWDRSGPESQTVIPASATEH